MDGATLKLLWIGYFPQTSLGDLTDDERMARALERAGATVQRCNPPWRDAERRIAEQPPDWVIFSKCREFSPHRLRKLRAAHPTLPCAQLLFDVMDYWDRLLPGLRWFRRSRLSWWLPLARQLDLVFLRERGHFERYARWGVRCAYLDQACDREEHPAEGFSEAAVCDVAFFGTFLDSRFRALNSLDGRHDVRVYAIDPRPWRRAGLDVRPAVFGDAFAEAVAGARIVYGESASLEVEVEGYWSDRVYRVLGRRGFLLCRYAAGIEATFKNEEQLVWFRDPAELEGLVTRYLADGEARRRIAEAGFRHVRAHHTYDHRAREMLDVLRRTALRATQ